MSFVHTRTDPPELLNCLVAPKSPSRRKKLLAQFERKEKPEVSPPKITKQEEAPKPRRPKKSFWERFESKHSINLDKYRNVSLEFPIKGCVKGYRFGELTEKGERIPRLKDIMEEVAEKHGIGVLDVKSKRRSSHLVKARQEFFYRARMETMQSLPAIAAFCGGRDHTTALHGVKKHALVNNKPLPGVTT